MKHESNESKQLHVIKTKHTQTHTVSKQNSKQLWKKDWNRFRFYFRFYLNFRTWGDRRRNRDDASKNNYLTNNDRVNLNYWWWCSVRQTWNVIVKSNWSVRVKKVVTRKITNNKLKISERKRERKGLRKRVWALSRIGRHECANVRLKYIFFSFCKK